MITLAHEAYEWMRTAEQSSGSHFYVFNVSSIIETLDRISESFPCSEMEITGNKIDEKLSSDTL